MQQFNGGAVQNRPTTSPNAGGPPPNPTGPTTLEHVAAQTADALLRCHSIVDRMEAVVFGPEPPQAAGGGLPVPSLGLANRMAEAASVAGALGDRLQRLAERLGG